MEKEKVHYYDSSSEAYDASQCSLGFMNIMVVKDEKVVAVADTWPIAVTKEHGELHQLKKGCTFDNYVKDQCEMQSRFHDEKSENEWFDFAMEQWWRAKAIARDLGYELL